MTSTAVRRWQLSNVLVAGRRLSGIAQGHDPGEAVRHFVAVKARELKVDVAAAVATATRDPYKKVEPYREEGGKDPPETSARPMTPKEFSDALGGLRSADWVRSQCQAGIIKTAYGPGHPPYLIPAAELARFRPEVSP